MLDISVLSQILGQQYLEKFLRAQDAIARSRDVLRKTERLAEDSYRLMGPGSSRRARPSEGASSFEENDPQNRSTK